MRRKYIALQSSPGLWKYAVAINDKRQPRLLKAGTFEHLPETSLAEQLSEVVGDLQVNDRLAWALPARNALFRWLDFPFDDARKIASTVRAEMSQRLPFADGETVIHHQLQADNRVLAFALEKRHVEEALGAFDNNREPLGYLGLAPLCYIEGLERSGDFLLLCDEDGESVLGLCRDGRLSALRILPRPAPENRRNFIQQTLLLARCGGSTLTHIRTLGNAIDDELLNGLEQAGFTVEPVRLDSAAGPLDAGLTGTGCLALAAARSERGGLNLRSGPYELKNDWQIFKRKMWLAAGLVLISVLALGGSAALQYRQKAAEYQQLKAEMTRLYRQEFPGEKLVASPALQLQSKIKELRTRATQFNSAAPGALQLLRAVSEGTDPQLTVDIQEYLQNDDGIRLIGRTTNFDAVSKLLSGLQGEALFRDVKIIDTKQSIDSNRVDFQLQIRIARQGNEP